MAICTEERGDAIYTYACDDESQSGSNFDYSQIGSIGNQILSGFGNLLGGIGALKGNNTYINNTGKTGMPTGYPNQQQQQQQGSSGLMIAGVALLALIIVVVIVLLIMKQKAK